MIYTKTINRLFKTSLTLFISFSLLLTAYIPVFAQGSLFDDEPETPQHNSNENENTVNPLDGLEGMYVPGQVIVAYEDTITIEPFQVNEGNEQTDGELTPGGLLDTEDQPVAVVNEVFVSMGIGDAKVVNTIPGSNSEVISVGDEHDLSAAMKRIQQLPGVSYVQPNFIYEPTAMTTTTSTPNDPQLNVSWHLHAIDAYDAWQALTTWETGFGNTLGMPIVGVVDSGGVATDHPEFSGRTIAGKGFGGNIASEPQATINFHGTGVAGVLLANRNNQQGGAGISANARLMALNVGDVTKNRTLTTDNVVNAINFARQNGAKILNLSFGALHTSGICDLNRYSSPGPRQEYDAIRDFSGLVVVAAGNKGARTGLNTSFAIPADFNTTVTYDDNGVTQNCWTALPNVLSVGGTRNTGANTNPREQSWADSNHGTHIDIASPAEKILLPFFASGRIGTVSGSRSVASDISGDSFWAVVENNPGESDNALNLDRMNGSDALAVLHRGRYTSRRIDLSNDKDNRFHFLSGELDCVNADNGNDKIRVQFSNDDGSNFDTVHTIDLNDRDDDDNIKSIHIPIPSSYETANFKYRFESRHLPLLDANCTFLIHPNADNRMNPVNYPHGNGLRVQYREEFGSTTGMDDYVRANGTSFAAPQVAGVAAMMLGVNPTLTAADLKSKILASADVLPLLETKTKRHPSCNSVSGGLRLNARRAVLSVTQPANATIVCSLANPTNVASSPDDGQLTISWDPIPNAESYEIRWRAAGRDTTLTPWKNIGAVTEKIITGLTNGTRYVVHIRAKNTIGTSEKTTIDFSGKTTPVGLPLGTPTRVRSIPGNGQLNIRWVVVPRATDYELRWRKQNQPVPDPWNYTAAGNTSTHTITGLTNNTRYVVHLRAKRGSETSKKTIIDFSTATTPVAVTLIAPTNVTSTPGNRQLTVSWDVVPNAESYEIRWRRAGYQTIPWRYTNVGTATTYTITGLRNNTRYTVHIRARSGTNTGPYTNTGFGRDTTTLLPVDSDGDGLIDIVTVEQLNNMRYNLYGTSYKTSDSAAGVTTGCPSSGCRGYELLNDLDFTGSRWVSGNGWTSIGGGHPGFAAEFEGNNHTISNLFVGEGATYGGLFGWLRSDTALVKNLTIKNASVKGRFGVGVLASGVIKFSDSSREVVFNVAVENSTISGNNRAGGLIGHVQIGIVNNSLVTGSTIIKREAGPFTGAVGASHQAGGGPSVGGFIGNLGGTVNKSSVVNSNIREDSSNHGYLGGFIGNIGGIVNKSSVINSTVVGDSLLNDRNINIGGFFGRTSQHGDIRDSYIVGSSVIGSEGDYVGGIIGQLDPLNDTTFVIKNVYSDVAITHGNGIYGHSGSDDNTLTITNSYYNKEKATATPLQPGAKTRTQLQSGIPSTTIYTDWSTDTWDFDTTTEFPTFR